MAIEKPQYRVVQELRGIEVREYAPYLAMTAPVSQQAAPDRGASTWVTRDTLPEPLSP